MNLQQLRIVRETVRQKFNLTEAANALFTSQSGVSKHIKDLEDELGVELFVRKGKRLLGLTKPGEELVVIVERMLRDASNVKRLAEQYNSLDTGQLTVVTTHTQARYKLPPVIKAFKEEFPKVYLKLHQGSPAEIVAMLLDGQADIGVATEALGNVSALATFPYYAWHHCVVVRAEHPLRSLTRLTLKAIAEYPLITYHEGFTGRANIDRAFAEAGLTPQVAISALDADVIKTYVETGLGVGIMASMGIQSGREGELYALDSRHLFAENTTRIALHRGHYLRSYAYRFVELCSPDLSEASLRASLSLSANTEVEP
jgi:LysR family cys regulon transcriptional activator